MTARQRQAQIAYRRALELTGDTSRAELVRDTILGRPARVAPLTRKAAVAGRLPASALADSGVRSRLASAGVRPRIPEGGLIGQFGKDIARAVVDAPRGYWKVAKITRNAALPGGDREKGNRDLRELGRAARDDLRGTVRHPLRHPGNTFLDLAMLATEGAGAAVAAPRMLRAVKAAPRAVPAAAKRDLARVRGLGRPDPVQKEWTRRLARAENERVRALPPAERDALLAKRAKEKATRALKTEARILSHYASQPPFRSVATPVLRPLKYAKQPRGLERDLKLAGSVLTTDAVLRRVEQERARAIRSRR